MSSVLSRPAWSVRRPRRPWLPAAIGLVLAVVVGAVMGDLASSDLDRARYGTLIGTSRQGEWADLSRYGLKARLDEVLVADSLPDKLAPDQQVEPLPGMLLVRVRMTVEPTIDIAQDNYTDLVSCDLALWNGAGERITATGPFAAGPELANCSMLTRPVVAGQQHQLQVIFQIRPSDQNGLYVQLTGSEIRPQAGGSWPVWNFIPA